MFLPGPQVRFATLKERTVKVEQKAEERRDIAVGMTHVTDERINIVHLRFLENKSRDRREKRRHHGKRRTGRATNNRKGTNREQMNAPDHVRDDSAADSLRLSRRSS
ncbi:hypothetical protein ROHU_025967 [Labeo rohita]|uniref:Uncharacterized protein n=1 Tax=Labeo rohita TaxID=84645 RepID=A0A498LK42_LABRO|nr:hypothetical protein ROHU_032083 [Labeo rohita]RXN18827.1 hypothetical protein ROHU_025967 [Labeo rohita]